MFKPLAVYILAAIAEIAGCYSLWAVLKLKQSPAWLIPGALSLCAFAWLLTLIDTPAAGRAYAAYGAIYIAASIGWMWLIEKRPPDLWDGAGLILCLAGSALILFAPRTA
ncbi:membrane protein [Asticcacaulis sp. AC466]|uniref:YnfA family protein n=1 Tax=Asticcacaulis sp. AC466 TaxID=1282362 RepID=UPI0003C3EB93|nr:YnfA family protein [Asticcacaulis sp. AC466]ESQ80705.1 membrane protein [Asticcacaulis sp. AC466]